MSSHVISLQEPSVGALERRLGDVPGKARTATEKRAMAEIIFKAYMFWRGSMGLEKVDKN